MKKEIIPKNKETKKKEFIKKLGDEVVIGLNKKTTPKK